MHHACIFTFITTDQLGVVVLGEHGPSAVGAGILDDGLDNERRARVGTVTIA
jgi:hypothetical protein